MAKMLVAYEACGCRAMALLDTTDPLDVGRFRIEAAAEHLRVEEEEHERIGAKPCAAHYQRIVGGEFELVTHARPLTDLGPQAPGGEGQTPSGESRETVIPGERANIAPRSNTATAGRDRQGQAGAPEDLSGEAAASPEPTESTRTDALTGHGGLGAEIPQGRGGAPDEASGLAGEPGQASTPADASAEPSNITLPFAPFEARAVEGLQRQRCKVCWSAGGFDFHVPDHVWDSVVPVELRGRVICLRCFDELAAERGVDYAPFLREVHFAGSAASFSFEVVTRASCCSSRPSASPDIRCTALRSSASSSAPCSQTSDIRSNSSRSATCQRRASFDR